MNYSCMDNQTINENISNKSYDQNSNLSQLTRFQDRIITTGSSVSIILLILLSILFMIQAIRKLYNHFLVEYLINKTDNALEEGIQQTVEDMTDFKNEFNPKNYTIYNAAFKERDEYLNKLEEYNTTKNITLVKQLQELLLRRAIRVIERVSALQHDAPGIRKSWQADLLPREVWDDFNAAHTNVNYEAEDVQKENEKHGFNWANHGTNIYEKAKEQFHAKKLHQSNEQRRLIEMNMKNNRISNPNMMPPMVNNNINAPKTAPPSARNFGSGFRPGFLNNQNPNQPRLSKKERKKLAQQEKEAEDGNQQQQRTQPRQRKGKRRFANK